ncbi:transcriptional regulator [Tistrella bauzanensis]|uniref:Transcriptional regulator n=1 Tax=Tistrella bauzanensis TaxID=657419 RepID=A0ABQ1IM40_9PROT|nr:PLP-dependent aminotransferase family protein [Tistrella bauzanensis]GGB45674.1 transcriptional regulator [Tistrella bauzanensis]
MTPDIDRSRPEPLADQLVAAIRRWIEARGPDAAAGAALPSIRRLAVDAGVSRNTVIEAYDRLVADGRIVARPGAGFHVAAPPAPLPSAPPDAEGVGAVAGRIWRLYDDRPALLRLGGGRLPDDWHDTTELARAIRRVAREGGRALIDYGTPLGEPRLRQLVARRLERLSVPAGADRVMLTTGGSQALDVVVRGLTRPGDAVLVEDPGYHNLFGLLRLQGVRMLGVPRRPEGPDLAVLEDLVRAHRPRLFITNTVLHNPTGSTTSATVAHRLLHLAAGHDLTIVEDDIYADFEDGVPSVRLAALDGLDRVVMVGSFSKPLSSALRVGYIAADPGYLRRFVDVKMLTSVASSRFAEQVVAVMIETGALRRQSDALCRRLALRRAALLPRMAAAGWEIFTRPAGGMFVWARHRNVADADDLVQAAEARGIGLVSGAVFRPDLAPGPWLRINLAAAGDPVAQRFLDAPVS